MRGLYIHQRLSLPWHVLLLMFQNYTTESMFSVHYLFMAVARGGVDVDLYKGRYNRVYLIKCAFIGETYADNAAWYTTQMPSAIQPYILISQSKCVVSRVAMPFDMLIFAGHWPEYIIFYTCVLYLNYLNLFSMQMTLLFSVHQTIRTH